MVQTWYQLVSENDGAVVVQTGWSGGGQTGYWCLRVMEVVVIQTGWSSGGSAVVQTGYWLVSETDTLVVVQTGWSGGGSAVVVRLDTDV